MKPVRTKASTAVASMILMATACGGGTAATTSVSSTSSTTGDSTTTTSTEAPATTGAASTSSTGDGAGTTQAPGTTSGETTTTLASGPFGSSVSTEGITAQLGYSLATPSEICTGFEGEGGTPSIEFQDGSSATVGSVVFICFPGFFDGDAVTITPPGGGEVLAFTTQRAGVPYVAWTVLPGDPDGTYTVSAVPETTSEETTPEESIPVESTFTVSQATVPGLRVVDPGAERWEQPEWPGRDSVEGGIFLAYFGVGSPLTVDVYGDPEITEVEADYVGSLLITPESGGAGILQLPTAGEEGFFCFSIRTQNQICDAAVQLFQ